MHYQDGKLYPHQPLNIESGIVVCGLRHNNCIVILSRLLGASYDKRLVTQGFLTTDNKFVSRIEAFEIACKSNQFITEAHNPPKLDSSDIY